MRDFLFALFNYAPVSFAITLLFWTLYFLEKCFPLDKIHVFSRTLHFWEKWILIMFTFSNKTFSETTKQSLLVILAGVPCELETQSWVLLTTFLLAGSVGVMYSWWNAPERLDRSQPGDGAHSTVKWMMYRGASAGVHGMIIFAAVSAGDRSLALVFGCSEYIARAFFALVFVIPIFLSKWSRMRKKMFVPLAVCAVVIWNAMGPNLLVADMVKYYYMLNCGSNVWIFGIAGDIQVAYDALAHLIAGMTAAFLGLIQARLLCWTIAPLRLSKLPLLTFWFSEGVVPRVCVLLRQTFKPQ